MPSVTSGLARAIGNKSGWSWIAATISLLIVTVAAVTLFRLLRAIDPDEVIAALRRQSLHGLGAAVLFVIAGYITLTFYDVFALRAIGRKLVLYRVAALASFAGYTIGHNFGGTFFTSGVIRYRVYSGCGLSVIDVAKIAFITGLTYCLGSAFVLGFGVFVVPDAASAFDRLPIEVNRLFGLAALSGLAAYVLWLSRRARIIGRSNWKITMPGARGTLLQIAIASLDLTFVALAMYAVLPVAPEIGFLKLFVIFAIATLIGVVSYVPGSLGVMEAAMFIGLPQFQRADLLASLLTFRLMYFIVPLFVAVGLLGLREFRSVAAGLDRAA